MKKFSIKGFKRSAASEKTASAEHGNTERDSQKAALPRTSRFVSTQQGWFVKTRENQDLGPFESRSMAQEALSQFIKHRARASSREQSDDYKLGYSVHDVQACTREVCAVCIEAAEKAAAIQAKRNGS